MAAIGLRTLIAIYGKLGNTTFGGGDPTMLALRGELVDRRGILSRAQFALSYTMARVTPGTNVLAFCVATGYQLRGWPGAFAALGAVVIPSAAVTVVVAGMYESLMRNPYGRAATGAALSAALGIMFAGAWQLARPHLRRGRWLRSAVMLGGAFAVSWWGGWAPFKVVAVAAVAGALWKERAAE